MHKLLNDLDQKKVDPAEVNPTLEELSTAGIQHRTTLAKLIKRPQVHIHDLKRINNDINEYLNKYDESTLEGADIHIKYADYIDKETKLAERISELEDLVIKEAFDFQSVQALSSEAKEKLGKIKPKTIGQASRISGVSPADISVLMVYMGRW